MCVGAGGLEYQVVTIVCSLVPGTGTYTGTVLSLLLDRGPGRVRSRSFLEVLLH